VTGAEFYIDVMTLRAASLCISSRALLLRMAKVTFARDLLVASRNFERVEPVEPSELHRACCKCRLQQHSFTVITSTTISGSTSLHNVPGGINVHGLMSCFLKHFQFGPEYTVVSEYGGDASGDIAAAIPTWCRPDVCIAELRAPVSDAKLARLPSAFTCLLACSLA